ncbi:MAG: c-type cytochrome domain-containing protein, partial [Planctomycetaceae bacterium]
MSIRWFQRHSNPRNSSLDCRVAIVAVGFGALLGVAIPSALAQEEASLNEQPPMATAEQVSFFEKQIRPLLAEKCWSCHGEKKQESGLRLDSHKSILKGGDSGPVVVSGKPAESPLIEAVQKSGRLQMPPDEMLTERQIASLASWIKQGLPWPADSTADEKSDLAVKSHWAFQPLVPVAIPTFDSAVAAQVSMPVD